MLKVKVDISKNNKGTVEINYDPFCHDYEVIISATRN